MATLMLMAQEFYTSDKSNISEAQGEDALVSLVGAIGYGLTYGGSIFVSQLVMRVEKIRIVTLCGAVITSTGLFLAGFCTKVCALPFHRRDNTALTYIHFTCSSGICLLRKDYCSGLEEHCSISP